ncbi:MAG: RNA polymerase sigma factor, partial [Candidatus Poribacteria bacterium]
MNNNILVEQTLAGDHQAFNSLITDYYADIYDMILTWVKEPEDAKDLTQDVFISVYLDLPSLKDHKRFYSWLRQIAKHKCQNWKRKQIDFIPLHDDLISKEPSTDEVLILRETLAKVMEAIDNLPESEKRLLKEHYLDDVSYDELEARHGVSAKTLVVRMVRARRKIRDQLEKTLSAFVAFLHDHTESILIGGTEIMKLSIKTKLIAGGIAVMLVSGGTGVLVKHYSSEQVISATSQESSPNLTAKSVSGDGKDPVKGNIHSGKKVNQDKLSSNEQSIDVVAVSHKTKDLKIDGNKAGSGNENKKPLSSKEELLERIHQMDKNPEFKALNDRRNQLITESYGLQIPLPLLKKIEEHMKNPYSAFGLTKEEAMQREWTKEELAYMRKVGQDLEKEADKYRKAYLANQYEREVVIM